MPKKIKAVIFDMDGVLIDARDWHFEALNQALALFGYSINRYEHLTVYDGLPTRAKLELLTKDQGLPRNLHSFISQLKQDFTLRLVYARCKPSFQHELALSRLKAEGYRLMVASNSIRQSIEVMMGKAKLLDYFEYVLSNEDVKKAKPDPEIYTKACSLLKLNPKDCLVVEDNDNGVKSAEAAGTHLMRVNAFHEVTYESVRKAIDSLEKGS